MDYLLVKNISHHLVVSWKYTLWNQARNPAETGNKRWDHLCCLKTSARWIWGLQVDLASLKIYGYLHLWKFFYKDITKEKTLQAFLPMASPYCSFKWYHKCLDFYHHDSVNLSKPHLAKSWRQTLTAFYFLNTDYHASLKLFWKMNGLQTLTDLCLVNWALTKGLHWILNVVVILHLKEIVWICGPVAPKIQARMIGQHLEIVLN